MNQVVIKHYRMLLRTGFQYAGSFENPSIVLDSVTEKIVNCGNMGNYMQLYVNIANDTVQDIKYICSCDPTANVAVEILCALVKGKTLEAVASVTEQSVLRFLGIDDEELRKRAQSLLELLSKGIHRYQAQTVNGPQ